MTNESRVPVPGDMFWEFTEGQLKVMEVKERSIDNNFLVLAEDGRDYWIMYDEDEGWIVQ